MNEQLRDYLIAVSCGINILGWALLIGERIVKLFKKKVE